MSFADFGNMQIIRHNQATSVRIRPHNLFHNKGNQEMTLAIRLVTKGDLGNLLEIARIVNIFSNNSWMHTGALV